MSRDRASAQVGAPPYRAAKIIDYSAEQRRIITHRDGHIQVIACAGAGKTETVSVRVASLIGQDVAPAGIVAFTFTNAAADALKSRILRKVHELQPTYNLDQLSPMFVGTIHAFCLRFLQERAPRYAAFDLFEEHRIIGLLNREYWKLGLQRLGIKNVTQAIQTFLDSAAVVENELLQPADLPEGIFRELYERYLALLERYHVLTHDQCIARAVRELERPQVFEPYHARLRHLIVDEFQDINPAQANLIRTLGRPPVEVCVVGDDDQAIYQWRGSAVDYIRDFEKDFGAESVTLAVNRRSQKNIVDLAARFATTISGRLPKRISATRAAGHRDVQLFVAPTAQDEAEIVADAISRIHDAGIAYRDIGLLMRSVRTSAAPFLDRFEQRGIRYKCGGRTGLFLQPEAELLGRIYAYLAGRTELYNARSRTLQTTRLDDLLPDILRTFGLGTGKLGSLRAHLTAWRQGVSSAREADLVGSLYGLLRLFEVHLWDVHDAGRVASLGTLGRFSELLVDFESVTRRARRIEDEDGKSMRGGLSGGQSYLDRLVNYISYYAQSEYDDFEGEPDFDLDAVTVTTIHAAKGLEWPIVFVPCLSSGRFPSRNTGRQRAWLLPRDLFPAARYEGCDDDERRLFYVGLTRARDHLYLSTHDCVTTRRTARSPYFVDVGGDRLPPLQGALWTPAVLPARPPDDDARPTFSFSDVAFYHACPHAYRLQVNLGFQPAAAKELGYGKAVHHVLRRLADLVRDRGRLPTRAEVQEIFDREFYLPYADRVAFETMKVRAGALVRQYLTDYADDLERVWEVERAFELHLPQANITGRADVILDREGGEVGALALVDYKTRPEAGADPVHALQLAVYAAAARGEGFDVRAAYVHDLSAPKVKARTSLPVGPPAVEQAKSLVASLATGIRGGAFQPEPGAQCRRCDVRGICRHGLG